MPGNKLYSLAIELSTGTVVNVPIKENGKYVDNLKSCLSNIDAYTTKYKKAKLIRQYFVDGFLPNEPTKEDRLMVSYLKNNEMRLLEAAGNKFPELNRYLELDSNQVKESANFKTFFNDYLKAIKDPAYFEITNKCYIDFLNYEKEFLILITSYYRISRSREPYDQQFIMELAKSIRASLLKSYKTFRNVYITYDNYIFAMELKYEQQKQEQLKHNCDYLTRNYDADPVYEENKHEYEELEDRPKTI